MSTTTATTDPAMSVDEFRRIAARVEGEVAKIIVGQAAILREVLICLIAGGHALLEGVPGLGKTMLIRTIADTLDLQFSRIQFTPDLMPADIVGTTLISEDDAGHKAFRFEPGPIFANLVLADDHLADLGLDRQRTGAKLFGTQTRSGLWDSHSLSSSHSSATAP